MKNKENKKKSIGWKIGKVLIIILACILVLLLGVRGYFRLSVFSYYDNSEKGFIIPESNSGFIAQGISYDERSEYFFVTGYMKDNTKASPIYLSKDGSKKCDKKINLLYKNGDVFNSHCGGLSVNGDYVYVANGASLEVFAYNDIINAKNDAEVKSLGTFSAKLSDTDYVNVAFTTIHDGYIYIGEFYKEEKYPTTESHKIKTPAGDYNQALMVGFKLTNDDNSLFGIEKTPSIAYSMTDLVQGACFYKGKVYLSTSWAVAFSHLYSYDLAKATKLDDITVLNTKVNCYALDSACLVKDNKIAPMSEEIEIVNDKMYIMCESASDKYIFGKFTSGYWCYKYDVKKED